MAGIDTLMVTNMITARADETVADVVQRMARNNVGAMLVMEGNSLKGLFSERDLMVRVVAEGRDPAKTPVGDVSTRDVVTVDVGEAPRKVLEILRERQFRHLPVTDGGRPVGILSLRDFLDCLNCGVECYMDKIKYTTGLELGLDPYDHLGGSYNR